VNSSRTRQPTNGGYLAGATLSTLVVSAAGAFSGDDPKGKVFAAERMAAASAELRDMVIDAWRTSAAAAVGYPKVKVREVEASKVIPIAEFKGRD
jgi:hypothetical protein